MLELRVFIGRYLSGLHVGYMQKKEKPQNWNRAEDMARPRVGNRRCDRVTRADVGRWALHYREGNWKQIPTRRCAINTQRAQ